MGKITEMTDEKKTADTHDKKKLKPMSYYQRHYRRVLNNGYTLFVKPLNQVAEDYYLNYRRKYQDDSGIDLVVTKETIVTEGSHPTLVDLGIQAAMYDSCG